MSDLISREDFDKFLEDAEKEAVKNRKHVFASALNTIRGNLKIFPSAQPEIIRCKDCTRFDKKRGCNLVEGLNIAKADSFCSWAERRGEEDE